MSKNTIVEIPEIVVKAVQGIEDVKGNNITVLDLRSIDNAVSDFFIICDGTSNTHVNAISNSVEKVVREEANEKPWHIEGTDNAEWILMDYVNTVVHVFQESIREFYDIESLWGDATPIPLENLKF